MAGSDRRFRIAFLTVDWNYELVENTLHGLLQYTVDHPDVQICVFDCFGKDLGNDKDRSEYSIFRLRATRSSCGKRGRTSSGSSRKAASRPSRSAASWKAVPSSILTTARQITKWRSISSGSTAPGTSFT